MWTENSQCAGQKSLFWSSPFIQQMALQSLRINKLGVVTLWAITHPATYHWCNNRDVLGNGAVSHTLVLVLLHVNSLFIRCGGLPCDRYLAIHDLVFVPELIWRLRSLDALMHRIRFTRPALGNNFNTVTVSWTVNTEQNSHYFVNHILPTPSWFMH